MAVRFQRKNPADLQKQLTELKGGSSYAADPFEWKPTQDSAGNGSAVIRFLPQLGDDALPFVKIINHGFRKNGQWYIHNCSATHNDYDSCPVCQYIKRDDLYDSNKAEYDLVKRKTSYWANILVISDKANPDAEGKVFKFRFGKKIFDKIMSSAAGDAELEEPPVDVTCPYDGADFVIKVKKDGKFDSYDESRFKSPKPIDNIDDEAVQNKIFDSMHDIMSIAAKDKFESFDELTKAFNKVMGTSALGGGAAKAAKEADDFEKQLNDFKQDEDDLNDVFSQEPKTQTKPKNEKPKETTVEVDDDFDDLFDDLDD